MKVSLTQYTVIDLCNALKEGRVEVNHAYQRSPKVWPLAARSFLIETILLGYPIPKIYLSQITDVKTKTSRQEIVDGQQRTMAVKDYFDGRFKLVNGAVPPEGAGKGFEDLDDDLKGRFLGYSLSADLFVGATSEDIREMFRRMNSYTVPLNAEEKRHANFQGEFKWFIYRFSKKYAQALEDVGVFTEKSLARMQDARLLSEFCYAVLNGIATTKAPDLWRMYSDKDQTFPEQKQLERRLTNALDAVIEWEALHHTALMKPYQMYALLLAVTHAVHPVSSLNEDYLFKKKIDLSDETVVGNLTVLASALEEEPGTLSKQFIPFVKASEEKTNVREQRRVRFQFMCRALDRGF